MRCKIFIPIFVVATIIMGFFSSIVSLIDRSGRTSHYFAKYWSRFTFAGVGIRVHLHGVENIPKDRAVIFAANHQSTMDIPAMFGWLPVQFRIMAKQVLFLIPFLGWHLFLSGNIPIDRKNARKAFGSVFKASTLLKSGISLLVFIEGTRTRDGRLQRFKRGSFTLAKKLAVPIVPVAIQGTFDLMPAWAWTSKGGDVQIHILPPIDVSAESDVTQLSSEVRRSMISVGLKETANRSTEPVSEEI
jgi:1-acyl-sn-glycerol-3-phosphate acyltransferase